MDGRRKHTKIFAAGQSSEIGRKERPCSRAFLSFNIGIMTEFFQIAGMSPPATKRLKNSFRKDTPWGPRWWRWSTVSPSGPWAVEEPAFLIVAAITLTSNSRKLESTRWWWWTFSKEPSDFPVLVDDGDVRWTSFWRFVRSPLDWNGFFRRRQLIF